MTKLRAFETWGLGTVTDTKGQANINSLGPCIFQKPALSTILFWDKRVAPDVCRLPGPLKSRVEPLRLVRIQGIYTKCIRNVFSFYTYERYIRVGVECEASWILLEIQLCSRNLKRYWPPDLRGSLLLLLLL